MFRRTGCQNERANGCSAGLAALLLTTSSGLLLLSLYFLRVQLRTVPPRLFSATWNRSVLMFRLGSGWARVAPGAEVAATAGASTGGVVASACCTSAGGAGFGC